MNGVISASADYDANAIDKLGYLDGYSLADAIYSAADSYGDSDSGRVGLEQFSL